MDANFIALLYMTLPALLLSIIAKVYIVFTFEKYRNLPNRKAMTSVEVLRIILDANGLSFVKINVEDKEYMCEYDPTKKIINVSDVFNSEISILSVGLIAHETGHALQQKEGYFYIALRSGLKPVADFISAIGPYLLLLGFIFSIGWLKNTGLILFFLAIIFYLIYIPTEIDAAKKARRAVEVSGLFDSDEIIKISNMLSSMVFYDLAGAVTSVVNFTKNILIKVKKDD